MQNAIWKLAALTGVLGIGLLAVLQAQRGLSRKDVPIKQHAPADEVPGADNDLVNPSVDLGPADSAPPLDGPAEEVAFGQYEPPVQPAEPKAYSRLEHRPDLDAGVSPTEIGSGVSQVGENESSEFVLTPGDSTHHQETPSSLSDDHHPQVKEPAFADDPFADRAQSPSGRTDSGSAPSVIGGPASAEQTDDDEPTEHVRVAEQDDHLVVHPQPPGSAGPRLLIPDPAGRPIEKETEQDDVSPPDASVSDNPGSQKTESRNFGQASSATPVDDSERVLQTTAENPDKHADAAAQQPDAESIATIGGHASSSTGESESSTSDVKIDAKDNNPFASTPVSAGQEEPIGRDEKGSTREPPSTATPETVTDSPSTAIPPQRAGGLNLPEPDPAAFEEPPKSLAASADSEQSQTAKSKSPGTQEGASGDAPSLGSEGTDSKTIEDSHGRSPTVDEKPSALGGDSPAESGGPSLSSSTRSREPADDDTHEPQRLSPANDAAPLTPIPPGQLQGDGVVDDTAPRGPQQPQLKLEKIAPQTALLGQPLIYSIRVRNVGDSPAHQVVVEDRIPKGSQLSGTIPQAELSDRRLIWKLGTLQPGEERKIAVRVVPVAPGQIGSVATVNFVSEVAAETLVTAPKLRLELHGPKQAHLGEPVVFHFNVTNQGSGDASGVVIRDLVPDGLSHPHGKDLEYEIGRLPAGETHTAQLTLTAAKAGPTVNRAVLTAAGGVSMKAEAPVEVVGTRLALARSGPERQYLGRTAVFTNRLTNEANAPVTGATVIETVPEGMEFVEASSGGQYNAGQRTVAWRIDKLGPKETTILKITLRAIAVGTHRSAVKAVEPDGRTTEATSHTEAVGFTAVELDLPPIEGPLDVGETVTTHVTVKNRGSSPATNVQLNLTLPDETELVSVTGPATYTRTGNQLRFQAIPSLTGGEKAVFEVTLKARRSGDARLKAEIQADQMQRPLNQESPILILSGKP